MKTTRIPQFIYRLRFFMSSSELIAIAGDGCMGITCRADDADRRDRRADGLIAGIGEEMEGPMSKKR